MKSDKEITHTGMRRKYDLQGKLIEETRVMLIEHKRTWQETTFKIFYSKEDGRRRPLTAVFPYVLENVQTIDESRCEQHDKDVAAQQHSEEL